MRTPKQINEDIYDRYTNVGFVFPDEPTSGDLVVGPDCVMRSAAGYYIGQYSFEYMDDGEIWHGEWSGPFPYARDTSYMSKEDAQAMLARS